MANEDTDLIDRIVALRPILCRHAAYLLRQRAQLGAPDDFVQDTILTALGLREQFSNENLAGWLLSILHGHIRNARRRAHVRTSVPLSAPGASEGDDAQPLEFPVAASQEAWLNLDDAMNALRRLSAADQEIIWLARVHELSHEQIAARLRLPLGTLHARLSRATARLRKMYEADPQPTASIHVRHAA